MKQRGLLRERVVELNTDTLEFRRKTSGIISYHEYNSRQQGRIRLTFIQLANELAQIGRGVWAMSYLSPRDWRCAIEL